MSYSNNNDTDVICSSANFYKFNNSRYNNLSMLKDNCLTSTSSLNLSKFNSFVNYESEKYFSMCSNTILSDIAISNNTRESIEENKHKKQIFLKNMLSINNYVSLYYELANIIVWGINLFNEKYQSINLILVIEINDDVTSQNKIPLINKSNDYMNFVPLNTNKYNNKYSDLIISKSIVYESIENHNVFNCIENSNNFIDEFNNSIKLYNKIDNFNENYRITNKNKYNIYKFSLKLCTYDNNYSQLIPISQEDIYFKVSKETQFIRHKYHRNLYMINSGKKIANIMLTISYKLENLQYNDLINQKKNILYFFNNNKNTQVSAKEDVKYKFIYNKSTNSLLYENKNLVKSYLDINNFSLQDIENCEISSDIKSSSDIEFLLDKLVCLSHKFSFLDTIKKIENSFVSRKFNYNNLCRFKDILLDIFFKTKDTLKKDAVYLEFFLNTINNFFIKNRKIINNNNNILSEGIISLTNYLNKYEIKSDSNIKCSNIFKKHNSSNINNKYELSNSINNKIKTKKLYKSKSCIDIFSKLKTQIEFKNYNSNKTNKSSPFSSTSSMNSNTDYYLDYNLNYKNFINNNDSRISDIDNLNNQTQNIFTVLLDILENSYSVHRTYIILEFIYTIIKNINIVSPSIIYIIRRLNLLCKLLEIYKSCEVVIQPLTGILNYISKNFRTLEAKKYFKNNYINLSLTENNLYSNFKELIEDKYINCMSNIITSFPWNSIILLNCYSIVKTLISNKFIFDIKKTISFSYIKSVFVKFGKFHFQKFHENIIMLVKEVILKDNRNKFLSLNDYNSIVYILSYSIIYIKNTIFYYIKNDTFKTKDNLCFSILSCLRILQIFIDIEFNKDNIYILSNNNYNNNIYEFLYEGLIETNLIKNVNNKHLVDLSNELQLQFKINLYLILTKVIEMYNRQNKIDKMVSKINMYLI